MFGSIFWWVVKVGMAAALALGGLLLNWTGFDVELPSQSADTLFWLRNKMRVFCILFSTRSLNHIVLKLQNKKPMKSASN